MAASRRLDEILMKWQGGGNEMEREGGSQPTDVGVGVPRGVSHCLLSVVQVVITTTLRNVQRRRRDEQIDMT